MTSTTDADRRDEGPLAWQVAEWDRAPDEVWVPEGLRFEVGQRVRLNFSAECRELWGGDGEFSGHHPGFDGLEGMIAYKLSDGDPWAHHPHLVNFPEPRHCPHCGEVAIGVYASIAELIPLSDTDATAPGSEVAGHG